MLKVRKNGLYLRLSIADGDLGKDNKDESNSIDNQRTLLVNFVQDLYLIADYRDVKKPNMDMGFPLDIARRDIKRTYRLLDEEEKRV